MTNPPIRGNKRGYSKHDVGGCLRCGQSLRGMILTFALCPCCMIKTCTIRSEHTHLDAQGNVVTIVAAND